MKTFVHVLLVAACFVACVRSYPSGYDTSEENDFDDLSFNIAMPSFFSDTVNKLRQNFMNYFWNLPDITNMNIPEGANTTSTTKIINGHVVTINETTYSSGDELGGTAFRIRIIDVKPQNDTVPTLEGGPTTVKSEPSESRETVEEFDNEISKNRDTLNA